MGTDLGSAHTATSKQNCATALFIPWIKQKQCLKNRALEEIITCCSFYIHSGCQWNVIFPFSGRRNAILCDSKCLKTARASWANMTGALPLFVLVTLRLCVGPPFSFMAHLLVFIADSAQPRGACPAVAADPAFAANVLQSGSKRIHKACKRGEKKFCADLALDGRCTERIHFFHGSESINLFTRLLRATRTKWWAHIRPGIYSAYARAR